MKSMDEVVRKMFLEEMAKLPIVKRAASSEESMCASDHDGFACTKAQGHKDTLHVAHSSLGAILREWIAG